VCISPWVDLEMTGDSMTSRAELDPMVQKPTLSEMASAYLGGADPKSPLASPLHANLAGLPPLLIMVGTSETLLDDSVRFVERARDARVEVTYEPWEDMIHVWPMFGVMPEAIQATDRIGVFLQQHLGA
jgi:acetyl esterase/lipase